MWSLSEVVQLSWINHWEAAFDARKNSTPVNKEQFVLLSCQKWNFCFNPSILANSISPRFPINRVAARAQVGWQRLTKKEYHGDKMSRMFVTTVSAIFVDRTHWSLSVRLFIWNFKLWQEPLIAGSVNFYKGKKKKVVRYKKRSIILDKNMN